MKRNDVPKHVSALTEAIEICDGQSALAAGLREYFTRHPAPNGRGQSVSQQTVSYWLKNGTLLEAFWWPAFEHVTRGRVGRVRLRPDVFPRGRAAA